MGNFLCKLPLLVRDNILEFLRVEDVKNLMRVDDQVQASIGSHRSFWIREAESLYYIDPALFMRLKSHHLFNDDALVRLVCDAHTKYLETVGNILAANSEDMVHSVGRKIITIAIDEEAGRIAVSLDNDTLEIHSLLRLRDPPLRSVCIEGIHHMVLHRDVVFLRHTRCPSKYHTDVYNWRIGMNMLSLTPGSEDIGCFRLKFSNRFLLAFDHPAQCTLAYQLNGAGYCVHPFRVPLPQPGYMRDHGTRDDRLFALLEVGRKWEFYELNIFDGRVLRAFLVAAPCFLYNPKIAYPYVMVTQVNRHHIPHRQRRSPPPYGAARAPFYAYGPRILIDGPDDVVLEANPIHSDGGIKCASSRGNFIFIADGRNEHSKIIFVGDPTLPFRPSDFAEHVYHGGPCSPGIVSFGLSVIFVQRDLLVFRNYSGVREFFT